MRLGRTISARSVLANDRLDAGFFADEFISATELIEDLRAHGIKIQPLGAFGVPWMPPRTALARAAPAEESVPYLRPYDVFDYLPSASDQLSVRRNNSIKSFQLDSGTILQTRSGRNLGPCTIVDEHLANFALSDDMIRIEIQDEDTRFFILAYLQTDVGQSLLRRKKSGSVIDHLAVADVRNIPIPVLDTAVAKNVIRMVQDAVYMRQAGRRGLQKALDELRPEHRVSNFPGSRWESWTVHARELSDRIDAAFYSPHVTAGRERLRQSEGTELGELAVAHLPVRYKRYYVERGYGRPILSGRQLLQAEPVNLRYVSDRSFRNPQEYEITQGAVIFGAVGRSEGRQAWPALVTSDRSGWLASNDVMRLVPRMGVDPGALWLAVAHPDVQAQIKALSFGSVIDHMNPWDVEAVIVPRINSNIAAHARIAWDTLGKATSLQREAVALLQDHLTELA